MVVTLLWDDKKKTPSIVLKGWNMCVCVCDSLNPEIAHHHLRKLSLSGSCTAVNQCLLQHCVTFMFECYILSSRCRT